MMCSTSNYHTGCDKWLHALVFMIYQPGYLQSDWPIQQSHSNPCMTIFVMPHHLLIIVPTLQKYFQIFINGFEIDQWESWYSV